MIIMVTMEPLSICEKCGSVRAKVRSYERVNYRCNCCKSAKQKETREQERIPLDEDYTDVDIACTKWLRERGIYNEKGFGGFGDYKA